MLQKKNSGFTLIELMITVAIIGILAGIAVPSYNSYIAAGSGGAGLTNLETLRSFEENYRIETNTYVAGTHTAGQVTSTLMSTLHWSPNDKGQYSYTVGLESVV